MKPSPIISWALLIAVVISAGFFAIDAVQVFRDREADLQQARDLAVRLEKKAGAQDEKADELARLRARIPEGAFWVGENREMAALSLQEVARNLMSMAGLQVTRTSTLDGENGLISLELSAIGELPQMQLGLYALERNSPPIRIDAIVLRSDQSGSLTAQMRLTAPFAIR